MGDKSTNDVVSARRRFLADCGKFAAATPPVVALLLSAANRNYAVAASNNGFGNGGGDGVPGNSGFSNSPQTPSFNADQVR